MPISEYKGYSKIGIGFCRDCGGYFERIYEGEDNSEFMECDIEEDIK